MIENLTEQNFLLFAAQSYDNPNCIDILEFQDDLNRIKYIKRLFKRYEEKGELKERLVINHLVTFYNVFPHPAATKLLMFKLRDQLHILKPFLIMLNYWPKRMTGIDGKTIYDSDIPLDPQIIKVLRQV